MKKELVLLCCLAAVFAANNFQERCIYYNEQSNVCRPQSTDSYLYQVTIDGQIFKGKSFVQTGCDQFMPIYLYKIRIVSGFSIMFHDQGYFDSLDILDESRTEIHLSSIRLIQKGTVSNPVTFRKKSFHCEIEGSGRVEPFDHVAYIISCESLQ